MLPLSSEPLQPLIHGFDPLSLLLYLAHSSHISLDLISSKKLLLALVALGSLLLCSLGSVDPNRIPVCGAWPPLRREAKNQSWFCIPNT